MNELAKRIIWCLTGIVAGLFIASNIWLHWRVSNVERTTSQIVQFLNTPRQTQVTQTAQPTQSSQQAQP